MPGMTLPVVVKTEWLVVVVEEEAHIVEIN